MSPSSMLNIPLAAMLVGVTIAYAFVSVFPRTALRMRRWRERQVEEIRMFIRRHPRLEQVHSWMNRTTVRIRIAI